VTDIELLTTEAQLAEVTGRWAELALEVGATISAQPLWVVPWWRHLGRGSLLVYAAFDGDRLVALAPLHERRAGPASVVRFLGFGLGAVSELLVRPGHEATAAAVWDRLLEAPLRRLQLAEYRLPSASLAPLERRGGTRIRISDRCPVLHVSGTAAEYLAARPKKLRATLRKAQERLTTEGRTHRVELVAEAAQLQDRLEDVRAVYDAAERTNPRLHLLAGRFEPFLLGLLGDAAAAVRLRLFIGYVDGVPVSFDAAFTSGSTLELWLGRFDPAFAAYAPGHLSFQAVAEHAFGAGMKVVDLGLGSDRYKLQWCDSGYDTATVDTASSATALRAGDAVLAAARLARRARHRRS